MRKARDYQRARCYKWERSQWWWKESEKNMLSLSECHALANRLTGRQIIMKDGRGCSNASGGAYGSTGGVMTLPRWARHKAVVCHEAAHIITPYHCSWHGSHFIANYIQLLVAANVIGIIEPNRMCAIDSGLLVA